MDPRVRMLGILLQATRGTLHALDLSIAHVLDFMKEDSDDTGPAPAPSGGDTVPEVPEDAGCPHPLEARVASSVMGHPNRFYCRMCMETIE